MPIDHGGSARGKSRFWLRLVIFAGTTAHRSSWRTGVAAITVGLITLVTV